jgi:Predicted oxidoreductases (related to aryl-alcohol dehydrogenases)
MRFRTYKNTDLRVSEVGFGLWTISTGWWGQFTEGQAIALMHKAFDLGITLFDAADTYGNGLSEELIAKAFPKQRDEIVIATKVGYDFVTHGESRGRGQREIPQDFSPDAIVRATDAALKRLKTDRIDLLQLHNIRMEQIHEDALWTTLEKLKASGKIRYYGIALGPAVGWLYEGVNCIQEREITMCSTSIICLSNIPGVPCRMRLPKLVKIRCSSSGSPTPPECWRANTLRRRFSRRAIIAGTVRGAGC